MGDERIDHQEEPLHSTASIEPSDASGPRPTGRRAGGPAGDLPAGGPSAGDAPGLEALYRQHCERLFAAAFRITGDPMDAEDVLQTVFLRLLRRSHQPDLSETAPGYLHRAAVNAALDTLRRRRRRGGEVRWEAEGGDETFADPAAPGPERERRARELGAALRVALARLSPAAAEVFALRYLEGWPNQEIARLLGMTQTAVAVSLHRTRRRLQRELASHRGA